MSHEEKCKCEEEACDCEQDCTCGGGSNCGCDCCGGGHFQRRFQTKAEQIEALEAYLKELRLEVQAVEEHLADLKK